MALMKTLGVRSSGFDCGKGKSKAIRLERSANPPSLNFIHSLPPSVNLKREERREFNEGPEEERERERATSKASNFLVSFEN
jgi:hypothetical protein